MMALARCGAIARRTLSVAAQEILRREKRLLDDVKQIVHQPQDLQLLQDAKQQLDQRFSIVVCGEFNAGKSQVINALTGKSVCKTGVTPTTPNIDVVTGMDEAGWRGTAQIVDTPGTNACVEGHQEIAEQYVPRADLILFVTSIDRPLTESERSFLQKIHTWRRKVVLLLNKIDMLDGRDADREDVIRYVQSNIGEDVSIFPVSAERAFTGKIEKNKELLQSSGFQNLEKFIEDTLHGNDIIGMKLESTLGIVDRLIERCTDEEINPRRSVIKSDKVTIDRAQNELEAFYEDMKRDFLSQQSHVENSILKLMSRCDEYFETHLTLRQVALTRPHRVKEQFSRLVIGDLGDELHRNVSSIMSWIHHNINLQTNRIIEYFSDLKQSETSLSLSSISGSRQVALQHIQRQSMLLVDQFEKKQNVDNIASEIKGAVWKGLFTQLSAVGVGAASVALSASAFDITGLTAAGVLGVIGLCVLPYKKYQLKRDIHDRIDSLKTETRGILQSHFDSELRTSYDEIRSVIITPYSRMVTINEKELQVLETKMDNIVREVAEIRRAVSKLEPPQSKQVESLSP